FRLRHADFSADGRREGIPWLGMPIAALGTLERVLVIGSFLRKDHPLIAHRLRQAAKRGAQVHMLHSVDDDWAMPIASKRIVPPSKIPDSIASFAEALKGGKNAAVLLGNFAQQHPLAARSEEHTSELQSRRDLVCRLLLEKKKKKILRIKCIILILKM